MLVYDEKYIKTKVKEFNGVVKTNFWIDKKPKEGVSYTSVACISIDSVMKIEKENYPQVCLEESNYKIKKKKITEFIQVELELDSDSDSK